MSFPMAYDVALQHTRINIFEYIYTLMIILFDVHWTCNTSYDCSAVYFIDTGMLSEYIYIYIYVHEYVGDEDVTNQKLCNVCGMAQILTVINLR